MRRMSLRKIRASDEKYFFKWWRDKELLKVTSGMLRRITDKEVERYFSEILKEKNDRHYIIMVNRKVIGHISLKRRKNGWFETQIVIGERNHRGRGYGVKAIKLLTQKAKRLGINKTYLEVRPNNTKAIRAYENCGFLKVGIKKYPKNKYLPKTIIMILRLK